jgi:putative ABC transport system permease protein
MAVGRLRDGARREEAAAEVETINRRLEADYPLTNRGMLPTVASHSETMSGRDARLIWGSLWVGAWLVLLIACANLANLTLVRTIGRWREFSTRIALGAGQARMIRQILFENLVLASVAALAGWAIATWSVRRWAATTASRYQILDYTIDSSTLAYLIAISGASALFLSVAPIVRVMQLGVSGALKGDARGVTEGLRGKRLAAGLVACQMALAIVLLSGAGVLVRSFVTIVRAETGVRDPDSVLVGSVQLPSEKYPFYSTRSGYFNRLEARLRSIPGIRDVTLASAVPVRGAALRTFEIEGRPALPEGDIAVGFVRTGADYFRVMGTSAIAGREFSDRDHGSALPVAIVNERFAATYWPGEYPLGKRLRSKPGEWRTVVGVVPNILQNDPLRQDFRPLVYVPFQQESPFRFAYFLLRTGVPVSQVAQAVRAEVQNVDPDVVLEDFRTLQESFAFDRDFMDAEHSELGKHAKVAPVFALIALLLSATGLTAVIAHSVSQRTKEIGVRMAIGAAARDVRRMVLREGLSPVAIGMFIGVAVSLAVNRVLQSQLVGVSPYDPVTLAAAPVLLIAVALIACQLPARRAVQIDPVVALRHE